MRTHIRVTSAILATLLLLGNAPATAAPSKSTVTKLTFYSKTVEGKKFSSKVLLGKKPSVLWFWAPWCAICHNESVNMIEAEKIYGERVNFVGVGALGAPAELREFVADTGASSFVNLDDSKGKIWNRFGVVIQPTLVFINAKGKITKHIGPSDNELLVSKLDKLIAS